MMLRYEKDLLDVIREQDNIFDRMTQEKHDLLCQNSIIKEYLDREDERIGKMKIKEIKTHTEWMTIEEFGDYLRNEIKRFYEGR